jgi:hypothetical protein
MIGANINAYFEAAMRYPVDRLVAVMRGQDKSIPQAAAMMALQIKEPMVDAAKGQEAAQRPQQPSVKERMEQEVSMLPENTGIMNLPVQQEFADGGIVAFNAGGLTPAEQAELDRRRREEMRSYLPDFGRIKERVGNWWENVQQIPFESKTPLIRYGKQERTGIFPYEQPKETLERLREEQPPPSTNVYPDEQFRGMRVNPPAPAPDTTTPPFVDARTPPAPPAGKGAGKGTGKGAGKAATKEEPSGIAGLPTFTPGKEGDISAELEKIRSLRPDIGAQYDEFGSRLKGRFEELAEERDRTKPQGKAMEGLEKLLTKEEEAAKGKESRNLNMALINAGLAIAGGTSQYAIQNIAEGAQVGTKQYQAGLEKLEEAAKERRRQAAAIEEARRAEARGDWKERNVFLEKAAEAELSLEKSKIEAISKMTGEDIATAAGIVNNQNQISARDRQVQYQGGVELLKQRMSDASAERRTARMAEAYGGNKDPINIATDNAAKEFQLWQQSSAGKLAAMDPAKQDAEKRRIFNDVFKRSGLPMPYPDAGGVNAPMPSGAKSRFLGFETQ